MLIGLSGYARSGKDAAATFLVARGFKRIALADTLRDILYTTDPFVPSHDIRNIHTPVYVTRLSALVDEVGWDKAKSNPEVRRLLQVLGTEAGRNILGEDVWVNHALGSYDNSDVVVTDVRFRNEAEFIRSKGGLVVRIERPGVGPVNDHSSDNGLLGYHFDTTIVNDGRLNDLRESILKVIA